MDKLTTYTTVEFLENFFASIDETSFSEILLQEADKIDTTKSLYDLIFSKSNLLYDDETKLEGKLKNPWFLKLISQHTMGGSKLYYYPNFRYILEDEETALASEPNSLHLYDNGILNQQLGYFKAGKSVECFKKIAKNFTYRIDKNQDTNTFKGWSQLFHELNLPINSAVICDNFMIKNYNNWKQNLFEIIKAILPKKLEIEFHLTLISSQVGELNTANGTIKPIFDKVQNFIEKLRCNYAYSINLNLIATNGKQFHDRHIFTNYYRITSGTSFDSLYNSKGKINADTYLEVKSLNSEKGGTSYFQEITPFKKILAKAQEIEVYGENKVNRLLE